MSRYGEKLSGATNLATVRLSPFYWRRLLRLSRKQACLDTACKRRRLVVILEEYIATHQAEQGSESLSAVHSRIEALLKPASDLWDALQIVPAGSEALHTAERLIDLRLRNVRTAAKLTGPTYPALINELSDLLPRLIAACRAAVDDIPNEGCDYLAPGRSWRRMVAALAALYTENTGLMATASKDNIPSAFVWFVHTVQQELPWQFRAHPKAIANAPLAASPSPKLSGEVAKALRALRTGA